ncbi:hypothetical protein LTR37_004471 [Vermiconidia calcicola]|uniref:Uncharacterized protein n=1 Tax=Vermiconidia calcicola TaxID=1690605 RepID=A0ACC3NNI3_9PEZI|nr:hypothetical protein LTR37_004471 [Vermiconidia calcicola]
MQRLPDAMLQALQQQREAQEDITGVEKESSRGRAGSNDGTEEGEEPLAVASARGAHSPSSPASTPFVSHATRHPRLSRQEVSPGGSRGLVGQSSPQASLEVATRERSPTGSRTPSASSRSRTTEAVPPQLLGGRSATDADLLTPVFKDGAVPTAEGPTKQRRPVLATLPPLSLSAQGHTRDDNALSQTHMNSNPSSPPKTPDSPESSWSHKSLSISSQNSFAISFAPMLRHSRADLRLFKKRSKPSEHLRKNPAQVIQRPVPTRTASYYKPKIIEDTASIALPTTTPSSTAAVFNPTPPAHTSVRKPRLVQSQSDSTIRLSPSSSPPTPRSPQTPRFGHSLDVTLIAPSRQARSQARAASPSTSRDSSPNRRSASANNRHSPSPASSISSKRRYRHDTPPESEPRTPSTSRPRNHYFRTFGSDTMYQEEASTYDSAPLPEGRKASRSSESPVPQAVAARHSSDHASSSKKKRKRSSILEMFRHDPLTESAVEAYASGGVTKLSSPILTPDSLRTPRTPDIKISTPQLAKSRSRSIAGSYFNDSRQVRTSSEHTPGPAVTPLSTSWEDVAAETQHPTHVREISEPLSPLTKPLRPLLAKPSRIKIQEAPVADATRQLPAGVTGPVASSRPVAARQTTYKSADGREYYQTSLTGPNALSFLPSEMKRVGTPPPLTRKPLGWKGFFFDTRSIPPEPTDWEAESPEGASTERRAAIFPKASLKSLVSKISAPKLKRKASELAKEAPKPPPKPLEVSGFEQTPFSQRYGDARRAKMSQIRSYLEETLQEDDSDAVNETFELSVPDHLPNSPLCPLSAKHGTGRKAICPIHGRSKRSLQAVPSFGQVRTSTLKRAPKIVFESQPRGSGSGDDLLEELRQRIARGDAD